MTELEDLFIELYRLTEQRKRMGHDIEVETEVVEKEKAMHQTVDLIETKLKELRMEAHRQVAAST